MGVYKKGINWYIDYYLPHGKRKREERISFDEMAKEYLVFLRITNAVL